MCAKGGALQMVLRIPTVLYIRGETGRRTKHSVIASQFNAAEWIVSGGRHHHEQTRHAKKNEYRHIHTYRSKLNEVKTPPHIWSIKQPNRSIPLNWTNGPISWLKMGRKRQTKTQQNQTAPVKRCGMPWRLIYRLAAWENKTSLR